MATTFVRPAARGDAGAALAYVHGSEGERVAAIKSDLGLTAGEALAQVEGYLAGTSRKRAGLAGVHSFAVDELDPADPASPQRAVEITYDLLKRQYGKDALGHVVAHLDSDSGLVHTHFFVPNHVLTSGKALRANWRVESLRKTNDALMRELGGPFRVPTRAEKSMTKAEFYTDAATLAQAADLPVSDLNYVTGREWARSRMVELMQHPAVESVEDLARLAPDHGLSVQIRPATAKSGPVVTLAVIGADGEPVTCADTGSKLAWAGKKLGKPFTYEAAAAEIQGCVDRRQREALVEVSAQVTPLVEAVPAVTQERPAPSLVAQPEPPATEKPQVRQPQTTQPKPQPVAAAAVKPQVTPPQPTHPMVSKTPVGQHPYSWQLFNKRLERWDAFEAWHERQSEQVPVGKVEGLHPAIAALPAETRALVAASPGYSERYIRFMEPWLQVERRQGRDPERTVDAVLSLARSNLARGVERSDFAAQRANQGPVRGGRSR